MVKVPAKVSANLQHQTQDIRASGLQTIPGPAFGGTLLTLSERRQAIPADFWPNCRLASETNSTVGFSH